MKRPTVHELVKKVAGNLDELGNHKSPIRVKASRPWLMKEFKPAKRGAALKIGDHEIIVLRPPADTPPRYVQHRA